MAEKITISAAMVGNTKVPAMEFVLPGTIAEALPVAARDMEILAEIVKRHPANVVKLIEATQNGNHAEIERLCDAIGLREEAFVKQGGGVFPIGAIIIVALLLAGATIHRNR